MGNDDEKASTCDDGYELHANVVIWHVQNIIYFKWYYFVLPASRVTVYSIFKYIQTGLSNRICYYTFMYHILDGEHAEKFHLMYPPMRHHWHRLTSIRCHFTVIATVYIIFGKLYDVQMYAKSQKSKFLQCVRRKWWQELMK